MSEWMYVCFVIFLLHLWDYFIQIMEVFPLEEDSNSLFITQEPSNDGINTCDGEENNFDCDGVVGNASNYSDK